MTRTTDRNPLRVLISTQEPVRDRLLNSIVDHSDPARVRYAVVTARAGEGQLADDMAARGVAVSSLGLVDGSLESIPRAVTRFRPLLRSMRPDVIHTLLVYPGLTCELTRLTLRQAPASVLARHHNAVYHRDHRRLHARIDGWTARRATLAVAVSDAVAQTMSELDRVARSHITTIHNGLDWERDFQLDLEAVSTWRKRFHGRELLVAVGRLSPVKDYSMLFRAVARVKREHPNMLLAIAGTGPERELTRLQGLAQSLGIAAAVEFLGWVPEPYNLMSAASVFVQASYDEAFSQTIAEAAGLGIPVATTGVGGVREILGSSYETAAAGDDVALAGLICAALDNPEGARDRVRRIASEVRSAFSAQTMAERYMQAYEAAFAAHTSMMTK